MRQESLFRSEEGVSEAVGEMLMVGITVMLFAIITAVVYGAMTQPQHTPMIDMTITEVDSTTVTIQHMGGESVSYDDLSFIVNSVEYTPTDKGDNDSNNLWNIGETITLKPGPISGYLNLMVYDKVTGSMLNEFTVG